MTQENDTQAPKGPYLASVTDLEAVRPREELDGYCREGVIAVQLETLDRIRELVLNGELKNIAVLGTTIKNEALVSYPPVYDAILIGAAQTAAVQMSLISSSVESMD